MKIDRALQRRILSALADIYPNGFYEPKEVASLHDEDIEDVLANIQYLDEHELVESGVEILDSLGGDGFDWSFSGKTVITARGLDFLADDGGLSSILNTVTVRLDAAQFAELLASKVENLPGVPAEERSELAKAIRRMPATAIEKLTEKMVDWTVDHAGEMLPLVRAAVALGGG